MTTAVPTELAAAIAEGQQRRAALHTELDQLANERELQQRQDIADKWQPILTTIAAAIPEWARPFVVAGKTEPEYFSDHCWNIRPATIFVPDVAPIFAYDWKDTVRFVAARFRAVQGADVEDELAYSVEITNGYARTIYEEAGTEDFLIALAEAVDSNREVPELEAEAQRRNDSMKKLPAPTPPIDYLKMAKDALVMGSTHFVVANALIAICDRLDSVIAPLNNGERAINTYDTTRPL